MPALQLVRFPDRRGVPLQPYSGYSPCHIQELLLEKPATNRWSLKFAGFSKAVETALFGKASGRGWRVRCLRRALVPSSSPALVWTGGPAKFWHRLKTWVDRATQCQLRPTLIPTIQAHICQVPAKWPLMLLKMCLGLRSKPLTSCKRALSLNSVSMLLNSKPCCCKPSLSPGRLTCASKACSISHGGRCRPLGHAPLVQVCSSF